VLPLSAASLAASTSDRSPEPLTPADPSAPAYRARSPQNAALVEALVVALCPADALTADGVTSGLAMVIDAYLAGDIDNPALAHRRLFQAGLEAIDAFSRAGWGASFEKLDPHAAASLLRDVRAGAADVEFPLSRWCADVMDPVLMQACFSAPVYEAYGSRMFVKLFG
jgi:hypothetical protein